MAAFAVYLAAVLLAEALVVVAGVGLVSAAGLVLTLFVVVVVAAAAAWWMKAKAGQGKMVHILQTLP